MTYLVRDKKKRFYKDPSEWVTNRDLATQFYGLIEMEDVMKTRITEENMDNFSVIYETDDHSQSYITPYRKLFRENLYLPEIPENTGFPYVLATEINGRIYYYSKTNHRFIGSNSGISNFPNAMAALDKANTLNLNELTGPNGKFFYLQDVFVFNNVSEKIICYLRPENVSLKSEATPIQLELSKVDVSKLENHELLDWDNFEDLNGKLEEMRRGLQIFLELLGHKEQLEKVIFEIDKHEMLDVFHFVELNSPKEYDAQKFIELFHEKRKQRRIYKDFFQIADIMAEEMDVNKVLANENLRSLIGDQDQRVYKYRNVEIESELNELLKKNAKNDVKQEATQSIISGQDYTKEEDKLILSGEYSAAELAKKLNRTKAAIYSRRARLKQIN